MFDVITLSEHGLDRRIGEGVEAVTEHNELSLLEHGLGHGVGVGEEAVSMVDGLDHGGVERVEADTGHDEISLLGQGLDHGVGVGVEADAVCTMYYNFEIRNQAEKTSPCNQIEFDSIHLAFDQDLVTACPAFGCWKRNLIKSMKLDPVFRAHYLTSQVYYT